MASGPVFPSLIGWEPTRETLHLYTRAVGVVPRAHAEPHPRWWHISLQVRPDGLATRSMPLPSGSSFWIRIDFHQHQVIVETGQGKARSISLLDRMPASKFGDTLLEAVRGLGVTGTYERHRFENADRRSYDPDAALRFFTALQNADRIFKRHRESLDGEKSPVQFWPHGFDLSFEWFGTRRVEYEEHGEVKGSPAQLNLGFAPGDATHPEPYFYSNPWPFEADELLHRPLPGGARWFSNGWKGSLFPYREVVGDGQAEARLLEYARAVFEISKPTLLD
jgi:hypothetical protein